MELDETLEYDIIELIKKRRHQMNLSRKALADKVGISLIHYMRIERREFSPSFKILVKILDNLGLRFVITEK